MKSLKKLTVTIAVLAILISSALGDYKIETSSNSSSGRVFFNSRIPVYKNVYGRIEANHLILHLPTIFKDNIFSGSLMIDWYPFENSGFKMFTGLALNGNLLFFKHYEPDKEKGVNFDLYSDVAYVFSIGYDKLFVIDGPFRFYSELGVMFQRSAKRSFQGPGFWSVFKKFLKMPGDTFESIGGIKISPMLKCGVKYKF